MRMRYLLLAGALTCAAADFEIKLDRVRSGYDGTMCWVHARAGAIPGPVPSVVLTMQKLLLTGSDVFYALNEMRTDDLGRSWRGPIEHETLGRRDEPDGIVVAASDFWPKWHRASRKLLGIGHTVRYEKNAVAHGAPRQTVYSVYDSEAAKWTPWDTVAMPDEARFFNAGAGSVQRVDLADGSVLIPIYFSAKGEKTARVCVMRCRFDGRKLTFIEAGNELAVNEARGLVEPSLTKFRNRFYLTIRQDNRGYLTSSADGLRFDPVKPWLWDDGTDLGNYNTQTHWVTHSDALYLVYTRKGAGNDHVFRHRAPLFIARVDPKSLRVIRATERILVPERGARLGNFGVTEVSANETWVTVTEWMQTWGPDIVIKPGNRYGADNTLYAARIVWTRPNKSWDKQ